MPGNNKGSLGFSMKETGFEGVDARPRAQTLKSGYLPRKIPKDHNKYKRRHYGKI